MKASVELEIGGWAIRMSEESPTEPVRVMAEFSRVWKEHESPDLCKRCTGELLMFAGAAVVRECGERKGAAE